MNDFFAFFGNAPGMLVLIGLFMILILGLAAGFLFRKQLNSQIANELLKGEEFAKAAEDQMFIAFRHEKFREAVRGILKDDAPSRASMAEAVTTSNEFQEHCDAFWQRKKDHIDRNISAAVQGAIQLIERNIAEQMGKMNQNLIDQIHAMQLEHMKQMNDIVAKCARNGH